MKCVVVAGTKVQASAIIKWMKLDEIKWLPIAYGDEVKEVFEHAKLVRPSEGVTEDQKSWVLEKLVPNLLKTATTLPPMWNLQSVS